MDEKLSDELRRLDANDLTDATTATLEQVREQLARLGSA